MGLTEQLEYMNIMLPLPMPVYHFITFFFTIGPFTRISLREKTFTES